MRRSHAGRRFAAPALLLFAVPLSIALSGGCGKECGTCGTNPLPPGFHPLGGGVPGPVRDLIVHDGRIVAAGAIITDIEARTGYVAAWDGTRWRAFGAILDGAGTAILPYRNDLVVGGNFRKAAETDLNFIALWSE